MTRTHTPATHDQPAELTAHAEAVLVDLQDRMDEEVYNDLHEEYAQWLLENHRLVVQSCLSLNSQPVRWHGGQLERHVRQCGHPGGEWTPIPLDEVWAEFAYEERLIQDFLSERLTEALHPTGPDRREEE